LTFLVFTLKTSLTRPDMGLLNTKKISTTTEKSRNRFRASPAILPKSLFPNCASMID
jgi:hypothetical protein